MMKAVLIRNASAADSDSDGEDITEEITDGSIRPSFMTGTIQTNWNLLVFQINLSNILTIRSEPNQTSFKLENLFNFFVYKIFISFPHD